MKRDAEVLACETFDLVVIGGGIFGACAALDAAERGLKVALIERGDLCGATSAHSYKIIHGGIRYLQHADIVRIRQSAAARRSFLKMAPHLTHPLPIVVPTYGHFSMKGRQVLKAGMVIYDALTFDRNRSLDDPARAIPNHWFLAQNEVRRRYPGLPEEGLSGAGVFCDGQMYNPPRIVLSLARAAFELGANIASYTEATGLVVRNGQVVAVEVKDHVTGEVFEIRTSMVLNAAGPYAGGFLQRSLNMPPKPPITFSRDTYFIVNKPLIEGDHALTVPSQTGDQDALVSRGARHLFLVPWHGATLVGVWHHVYLDDPDDFHVGEEQLQGYLDEINSAYPGLDLTLDDVSLVNAGLVPFGDSDPKTGDLKFGHRSRLIDHAKRDAIKGMVSLVGIRYTTAPLDAPHALDRLLRQVGKVARPSDLTERPAFGGDVDSMERLLAEARQAASSVFPANSCNRIVTSLVRNHGSNYGAVLALIKENPAWATPLGPQQVLLAEIVHAVQDEMALTLSDVVFRRTDLATTSVCDDTDLEKAASCMAKAAGWTAARQASELVAVRRKFKEARTGRMSLCDRPDATFALSKTTTVESRIPSDSVPVRPA